MSKIISSKYQSIIIFISLVFTIYLLGPEYINPTNSDWFLYGDLSTYQLGWKFFRFDEWRFPILSNPNYGIYLGSNLIYSDSIPLFAIIFKLFKFLLPENFQYFSIWIFVSIYLQILFSLLILYKISDDILYSFIGSFFFIFATIFIHRSALHLSLFGQWIILFYFYSEFLDESKRFFWKRIIFLLSITIHFYFTIMIGIIFIIEKIVQLMEKRKSLKSVFFETIHISVICFILMYVLGYFSISLDDTIGWGYGYYNFNLNSFINPLGVTTTNIDWSNFLTVKKFQNGEIEGFSYLGISGFIFFGLYLRFIFIEKEIIIYNKKTIILISVILFLISVSNNYNFGDTNLFEISLNKYIYALGGFVRASGRFIWPIYYLIFFIGIISILRIFPQKKNYIIFILLILQLSDISLGLGNYKLGKQYKSLENHISKNKILGQIANQFEGLRMLEPNNQSKIFSIISPILLKENIKKTDLVYLARVNRSKLTYEKYKIKNLILNNDLTFFNRTVFVSDNVSFVRYLYHKFNNELFFYLNDKIWFVSNERIKNFEFLNDLKLTDIYEINLDIISKIDFKDDKKIAHIGFKKILNKNSLYLDGEEGEVLFRINGEKCTKNTELIIEYENFFSNNTKVIPNVEIIINGKIVKNQILENNIFVSFNCKKNSVNFFNLNVIGAKSEYDLRIGLNREKRSIIIKSLKFI